MRASIALLAFAAFGLACPASRSAETTADAAAPPAEVTVIVTSTTTGASITTKLGDANPVGGSEASAEDRAAVRAIVLGRKDEVRACYQQALNRVPTLEGTVHVEWRILPSGQLDAVTIREPRIGDAELETCISTVTRSWTFPLSKATSGAVLVRYPFRFVKRE